MARHYRKIIRITAEDSPNVQVYLQLKAAYAARGLPPPDPVSCPMVTPGVLSASEYVKRLATFDDAKISVSLHARFWEGRETLLFPPTWLDRAELLWRQLQGIGGRKGEAMGIDTGEGSAESVWVIGDKRGILEMSALKTPDTNFIHGHTIMLINKWNVPHSRVCFDRGGGGKQAADRLRACGFGVRTVAFGESVRMEPKRARVQFPEKKEIREETYAYKNRRAQMYHLTSQLMDPMNGPGWGLILDEELRRQLSVMPKVTDDEGRYYLPPKNRRDDKDTRNTLTEMLGCSPDRADALVLMVFGLTQRAMIPTAGVA